MAADSAEIRTERLRLRRLRPADEQAVLAYRSDHHASRFLAHPPLQPGQYAAWLSERSAEWDLERPGDRRFYGIEVVSSGALAGDAVLVRSADGRQGELGMFLAPGSSGFGYSLEAGTALLEVAFGQLGLHRMVGRADADNVASVRAMERLGLRCEGRFRQSEFRNGAWVDTVLYALLRSEWCAGRQEP